MPIERTINFDCSDYTHTTLRVYSDDFVLLEQQETETNVKHLLLLDRAAALQLRDELTSILEPGE